MKKALVVLSMLLLVQMVSGQDGWSEKIWDTITFEQPYPYLEIDTSWENIWQTGTPGKVFFDSAFSVSNAIVTDTIHPYPVNNLSWFDLKVGQFNFSYGFPMLISIEMQHKFDTDSLKDGGFISISYDQGITWMNIIRDTVYMGISPSNPYIAGNDMLYTENDTLFNGEAGFSGFSGGWITTRFSWYDMLAKSTHEDYDTLIIRFTFISDNEPENREGWMIDNIRLYTMLFTRIVNNELSHFRVYPNPMGEYLSIELDRVYGEVDMEIINFQGQSLIHNKYANQQTITIHRNNLKKGIYLVRLRSGDDFLGVTKLLAE
jgi:hypothetical protein